jgi:hypothetical protein
MAEQRNSFLGDLTSHHGDIYADIQSLHVTNNHLPEPQEKTWAGSLQSTWRLAILLLETKARTSVFSTGEDDRVPGASVVTEFAYWS